jgi:hypothetical protein
VRVCLHYMHGADNEKNRDDSLEFQVAYKF